MEGLFGEKYYIRGHNLETPLLILHSSYETSHNLFNKLDLYSLDGIAHEDYDSSIAHEVVKNENSILSNIEYVANEGIPSSTSEDDATIDGGTPLEAIEEEFDSSTTDSANGNLIDGDTSSEEMKEDLDSSHSNIYNGAYANFTITNLEDSFSSIFDVVDHVPDPLFEHFSNPQKFIANLDVTNNM